jgi:hypothetical protein
MEGTALGRERHSPRSGKRLRQPGEHHEVGVKGNALQAASAKRGEGRGVIRETTGREIPQLAHRDIEHQRRQTDAILYRDPQPYVRARCGTLRGDEVGVEEMLRA